MEKEIKISFLIAAHNEEKVIGKALDNLIKIPYKNYEVIVGLDGCTDRTEDIVKKFWKKNKKIKYFIFNLRRGKTAVINELVKKATGDIIIIHDADWIFYVKNKQQLNRFISVFKDPDVGGIAESFPIEWEKDKIKKGNVGYKMNAYVNFFWMEYMKKRFAEKINEKILILKNPAMFMTNIFRKDLYKTNFSLADDFERTHYIMDKGFKIILFDDPDMPRFLSSYHINLRDIFKQKIRTAIARKQLEKQIKLPKKYYCESVLYIIKKCFEKSFFIGLLSLLWCKIMIVSLIISKFKKINTKEGWKLRVKR